MSEYPILMRHRTARHRKWLALERTYPTRADAQRERDEFAADSRTWEFVVVEVPA